MTTTSDPMQLRLPAEWEPQGAVLMAWPHAGTDWAYMLPEVQQCYREIIAAITAEEHLILLTPERVADLPTQNLTQVIIPTNDTWTRDYGPLTAVRPDGTPVLLDFRFNGWGMKFAACHDNQTTRLCSEQGIYGATELSSQKDMVLEGGSIESDGCGTILTTACCLLAPNRNEPHSRLWIEQELRRRLGARKVLWLDVEPLPGDDTDGHVDTLCRLAPNNTILYTAAVSLEQLRRFTTADGEPYNLIELPTPDPIFDEGGEQLPATYANYLVTNRSVLMPAYGQPRKDQLAADTLRVVFDGRSIIPIDCRALIRQHGSLHCATMQIPVL